MQKMWCIPILPRNSISHIAILYSADSNNTGLCYWLLHKEKMSSSQEYETIFLIIETLYVRFLLVGRQKGSLLEPVIAMWAKEATNKEKSVTSLIQKWISDARKIEEKGNFLVSFQMLKTTSKKKALYILTKIEAYKGPRCSMRNIYSTPKLKLFFLLPKIRPIGLIHGQYSTLENTRQNFKTQS